MSKTIKLNDDNYWDASDIRVNNDTLPNALEKYARIIRFSVYDVAGVSLPLPTNGMCLIAVTQAISGSVPYLAIVGVAEAEVYTSLVLSEGVGLTITYEGASVKIVSSSYIQVLIVY